jgi:hypothetical protein
VSDRDANREENLIATTPRNRRRRAVAMLFGAVVLLSAPSANGAAVSWLPVTGPTSIIAQVAKVRGADGALHVVWVRQTPGGSSQDVLHAKVGPDGAVSAPTVIASAYSSASNPAIVNAPGGVLRVFFGAIQCTAPSCPSGLFTATSSDGGRTWTTPAALFNRDQEYASDMNAAALPDGTPFETWSHTLGVSVHRGLDPATQTFDYQGAMGAGCCGYYGNLAVDGAGHIQLAWDSNATGFLGVWSQAVDPATGAPQGAPMRLPESVSTFNGTPSHVQMLGRTPITARAGHPGEFWVAYNAGYPSTTKVVLWKVGTPASATVVDEPMDHNEVALAADSAGRLWVFWTGSDASGNPEVFARRTSDGTSFEPPIGLGAPPNTSSIYHLDADVTPAGDPEVLALAGQSDGVAGTFYARGPQTVNTPPVLGKSVNVEVISGQVFVKLPPGAAVGAALDGFASATPAAAPVKGQGFIPLTEVRQLPVGSEVDARAGAIRLTSASTQKGKTYTGDFQSALFTVLQSRSRRELGSTTLQLVEDGFPGGPSYGVCARPGRAQTASVDATAARRLSSRVVQLLHANVHGRFQTRGRYSAATVRGTSWDTIDRCDGTLTVVHRGTVVVTDLRRRLNITLHAGKSYLARAP